MGCIVANVLLRYPSESLKVAGWLKKHAETSLPPPLTNMLLAELARSMDSDQVVTFYFSLAQDAQAEFRQKLIRFRKTAALDKLAQSSETDFEIKCILAHACSPAVVARLLEEYQVKDQVVRPRYFNKFQWASLWKFHSETLLAWIETLVSQTRTESSNTASTGKQAEVGWDIVARTHLTGKVPAVTRLLELFVKYPARSESGSIDTQYFNSLFDIAERRLQMEFLFGLLRRLIGEDWEFARNKVFAYICKMSINDEKELSRLLNNLMTMEFNSVVGSSSTFDIRFFKDALFCSSLGKVTTSGLTKLLTKWESMLLKSLEQLEKHYGANFNGLDVSALIGMSAHVSHLRTYIYANAVFSFDRLNRILGSKLKKAKNISAIIDCAAKNFESYSRIILAILDTDIDIDSKISFAVDALGVLMRSKESFQNFEKLEGIRAETYKRIFVKWTGIWASSDKATISKRGQYLKTSDLYLLKAPCSRMFEQSLQFVNRDDISSVLELIVSLGEKIASSPAGHSMLAIQAPFRKCVESLLALYVEELETFDLLRGYFFSETNSKSPDVDELISFIKICAKQNSIPLSLVLGKDMTFFYEYWSMRFAKFDVHDNRFRYLIRELVSTQVGRAYAKHILTGILEASKTIPDHRFGLFYAKDWPADNTKQLDLSAQPIEQAMMYHIPFKQVQKAYERCISVQMTLDAKLVLYWQCMKACCAMSVDENVDHVLPALLWMSKPLKRVDWARQRSENRGKNTSQHPITHLLEPKNFIYEPKQDSKLYMKTAEAIPVFASILEDIWAIDPQIHAATIMSIQNNLQDTFTTGLANEIAKSDADESIMNCYTKWLEFILEQKFEQLKKSKGSAVAASEFSIGASLSFASVFNKKTADRAKRFYDIWISLYKRVLTASAYDFYTGKKFLVTEAAKGMVSRWLELCRIASACEVPMPIYDIILDFFSWFNNEGKPEVGELNEKVISPLLSWWNIASFVVSIQKGDQSGLLFVKKLDQSLRLLSKTRPAYEFIHWRSLVNEIARIEGKAQRDGQMHWPSTSCHFVLPRSVSMRLEIFYSNSVQNYSWTRFCVRADRRRVYFRMVFSAMF